jgi:hypothetical protein
VSSLCAADKEALRKQAADAMRAVEMRSLTLLHGSAGGGKNARGPPMASSKSGTNMAAAVAAALAPDPPASNGAAPAAVPVPAANGAAPPPQAPPARGSWSGDEGLAGEAAAANGNGNGNGAAHVVRA